MIFYSITLHRIKKEKYMLNVTNDIIHIIEEKLKKNKKGEFKEIKDFSNVIKACDEVLKIENNNIKALYRKAKAFIDDPKSLIEQYNEAENLLIKANKLEPNNSEIKKVLEQFSKKLNEDKQKENKIYKKYYNKYNEITRRNEK